MRSLAVLLAVLTLGGCANGVGSPHSPAKLVSGPPVQDVVTPYDKAIACLSTQPHPNSIIAVGEISDSTGRDSMGNDGQGRYITQAAGDIVQTALKQSGVSQVVNRRDPRVMIAEIQWGIRSVSSVIPAEYFVTGSINTLDFIPGATAEVSVAGIGPNYRQYRALVGLDLALTKASTGEVVAISSVQKQIFADDAGFGVGRFFGTTLVQINLDTQQREAMQFALRSMLYYATFELMTQLYQFHDPCSATLTQVPGVKD